MSEDKLVPCIRFKGFVGEWENRSFKDIVTINSGKDYKHLSKGDIPVYGTGGLMLYVNDKLSEKDAIGIGRKGTIDRPQFLKAPFWTVDTLFFMVPKKKFNIYFVYCLSEKTNWKKYDESTGLPSLSKSTISKISSFTPPLKEQQKIGGLFAKLDRLLDLQQQKLDQLELLKKALLQKLFPKQDVKIPELRFKGFEGEWKKDTIGEIARTKSGGTPSVNNKKYYDGNIPFIRSSDINKTNVDLKINDDAISNSAAFIVKKGNILYALYGATSGQVAISRITGAVNQAVLAIFPKQYINKRFLVYWFSYNKEKITTKYLQGGQGNLSAKIIKKLLIRLPLKDEQQKIGNLLAKIDRLIELENKKISNLKLVKKSLLQNMFVE